MGRGSGRRERGDSNRRLFFIPRNEGTAATAAEATAAEAAA